MNPSLTLIAKEVSHCVQKGIRGTRKILQHTRHMLRSDDEKLMLVEGRHKASTETYLNLSLRYSFVKTFSITSSCGQPTINLCLT